MLYRVHGLAQYIFYNIEQIYYHATTVRATVMKKGNANKEELRNFILNKYKNLKFDDDDQSDAYALGLCHFIKMRG